jgi:hypothetical protein
MIKEKLFELRQLKEKILYLETDINILKQINSKQMFEYAKMEMKQLKQLKTEFQQVQQELHDLLDKETKQ